MKVLKFFSMVLLTISFIFIVSFKTSTAKKNSKKEDIELRVENVNSISETFYKSMYNGKVKIYSLTRKDSNAGYSIWLYRTGKNVKAKYFAFTQNGKSIYQRYLEWKRGKQIISYCAGPYTSQDYRVPQGLTIDDGNLVNRNIDEDLDGLIIVERVGGVRVADLEKPSSQCIYLVSIDRSLNPRNSSEEKNTFIKWARDQRATVFQTNLMYFKNEKMFKDVSATANRRIFVLGIDNGEVVHIIFNITNDVSLTKISKEIYNYLNNRNNFKVIGILNFDTGMYNIFQVFNEDGSEDSNLRGTTSVSNAQNLMVYYYDN